jgi:hypothetical protein
MRHLVYPVLLISMLAACGETTGSDIGNPAAGILFQVTSSLTSAESDAVTFEDDSGTLFTLTHARAYLRNIQLELPGATPCRNVEELLAGGAVCHDQNKIEIPGPIAVDLLNDTSTPDISDVRIPALAYRRIDFRLDDGDPDDGVIEENDELNNLTLVARADFRSDGQDLELLLMLRFNEDVRFDQEDTLQIPEGGDLLVQLDVARWLNGIPVIDCIRDGNLSIDDGRVVIDEDSRGSGSCSGVEGDIKQNIKDSGEISSQQERP